MKLTFEEQISYVNQTIEVLRNLNDDQKKEEYRRMSKELPPSETFVNKFRELFGKIMPQD